MNWLYYIAEANLYLGVFYLAYCIFLSKETHYQFNRGYLIAACLLAFLIPVVQLGFLMPVQYLVLNDEPVIPVVAPAFTWMDALVYLYVTGVAFFATRFVIKLYQLKKLISNSTVVPADNYTIVSLHGADTAFSFFNYLFIGTRTGEAALITRHELVHIKQKHSVDIIFTELLQIISWFNPVVYLLQNSLKTIHEYVADEQTAMSETDTIAYATYLLNNAYGISGPAMTHSFFNYNLLKKRITMLHQKRSGNLARLKYLLAAPLCMGLLYQSTFGFDKTYGLINIAPKAPVIIEPQVADTIPAKPKLQEVQIKAIEPKEVKLLPGTEIRIDEPVPADKQTSKKVKGISIKKVPETITIVGQEVTPGMEVSKVQGNTAAKGYVIRQKVTGVQISGSEGSGSGKGYIIRKKEPEAAGTGITIEGEPAVVGQVKGSSDGVSVITGKLVLNAQTASEMGVKINEQKPLQEVRISEPAAQTELRIDEPKPLQEVRIDPVAPSKQQVPPPAPPKPDVKKVKFPPPTVKVVKFPPPVVKPDKPVKKTAKAEVPPKPDVSKVKFPPPVVKPDKPTKKVVKFPPPVVKPDNK